MFETCRQVKKSFYFLFYLGLKFNFDTFVSRLQSCTFIVIAWKMGHTSLKHGCE